MNNYEEISARMEEGNVNRTIASTNMNATSSRAHTIVGIRLVDLIWSHLDTFTYFS